MNNGLKTTVLLGLLTGLVVGIGHVYAGMSGAVLALAMAGLMNFFMYWFSDRIVLAQMGAEELPEEEAPEVYRIVRRLCERANMPMPDLYLVEDASPNAFATGRNPENAAVGVTSGILRLLDSDELEGVLAHELSHVRNRDTLINAIAATMAGAISMLKWFVLFGGDNRRGGGLSILFMFIVTPIIAAIIKSAVSRSREHVADESGGELCGKPMNLARALRKLHDTTQKQPMRRGGENTAHMFIVNPFSGQGGMMRLLSSHPPVEERIEALEKQAHGGR